MANSDRPVVLITGCSSGIGLAAARRFAARGFRVWATMRKPESGRALADEAAAAGWSVTIAALDVTSDAQVAAAVASLLAATSGRIDVLINNAGYYAYGPVEETSPADLHAQFDTNVVGALRLIRATLPAMRARGQGAIVNISSISGVVVVPAVGAYHASKYALEAMTEALRYEVSRFGIRVALVEPGPFQTELHANEVRVSGANTDASPYKPLIAAYLRNLAKMRRGDPAPVVDAIFSAATTRAPKLRWRVGPTSFTGGVLRRFVPDRLYELVMRFAFR